jgi:hypothetical protein
MKKICTTNILMLNVKIILPKTPHYGIKVVTKSVAKVVEASFRTVTDRLFVNIFQFQGP